MKATEMVPIAKPTYDELLQQEEWKAIRRSVLSRDEHQCFICQSTHDLNVHHRQYHRRDGELVNPWEYDLRCLITLCQHCHQVGHKLFNVPVINLNLQIK